MLVSDWTNEFNARDVNVDGDVSPVDALVGINELNGRSILPLGSDNRLPERAAHQDLPLYDVNGDESLSPLDVLIVINALNDGFGQPDIFAVLARDTGVAGTVNDDNISSDATLSVSLSGTVNQVARVTAQIDGGPRIDAVASDGGFSFDPGFARDGSDDGNHTVRITAFDQQVILNALDVTFTYDTQPPAIAAIDLASDTDSAPLGDLATEHDFVTIQGQSEPETSVDLLLYGATTATTASGEFQLRGVPLSFGSNPLSVRATDRAGNEFVSETTFQRTPAANALLLSEEDGFVSDASQVVELGGSEGTRTLSFRVDAAFDTSDDTSPIEDTLLVYLVDLDDSSQTLLDRGQPGSALFSLAGGQAEYSLGLVRFDGSTVQIDVSSLSDLSEGRLLFQLLNIDNDTETQVAVSDIASLLDPEGAISPTLLEPRETVAAAGALDVSSLSAATGVVVALQNQRFDSATGHYAAELRLFNQGAPHGRTAVVLFRDLPSGVTVRNASGVDGDGNPYLNLTPAIASGGLRTGEFSEPVLLEIDNPALTQFSLDVSVLGGAPNNPPELDPIGTFSMMPGETVTIPLPVVDDDGDDISYLLGRNGALPNVTLGSDRLIIQPSVNQLGTYQFALTAWDGALETSRQVEVEVTADPITTTRISGTVLDTLGQPLEGVPVEIAGFRAVTAVDGTFKIELPTLKVPTDSFPIDVPAGDTFLDPFNTGIQQIPFRRARFDPASGDSIQNPLMHPNLITSFIDAGMVYGNDPDRALSLRTLVDGGLKTSSGELLPLNDAATFPGGVLENDNEGRIDPATLFATGDVRANENVALLSLQTLLVREHNRLAGQLKADEPSLDDEQIYQHARRLVNAIIQQITFYEYLPVLLGEGVIDDYDGYDPNVDPSESVLFAVAAYRVGHSQVFSEIQRLDASGQSLPDGPLEVRDAFFTPVPIQADGIEPYLRGLVASQAEQVDPLVIDDLRNFLFGPPGSGGMDLAAMNIQRGRDMGLPSYNQARIDFGLTPAASFDEITSDASLAAALATTYGSVDDVDVWIGGLAEDHVPGSLMGSLFTTIVADQFIRTRNGDRFWFENQQLTADELSAVRATTLASLIERNTTITGLPANVFTTGIVPPAPNPTGTAAASLPTEFRTVDGIGNNINDPSDGAAGENLTVDFTLDYGDEISTPSGQDRPNPREISNALQAQATSIPNTLGATGFVVYWGQLIDHDFGLTPGGVSDTLKIHGNQRPDAGDGKAYPFVAERMPLMLGRDVQPGINNVIDRPIYLPVIDIAGGTTIDPNNATMVEQEIAPGEMASVFVQAGTLKDRQNNDFTGVLSITEVPRDLTPASLPENLVPDTVVTIQPADMVFTQPAPLTLPNRSGLAPGIKLTLWSINPVTGEFDDVGIGEVSTDGTSIETITGGVRNSSWHFFSFLAGVFEFAQNLLNQDQGCSSCPSNNGEASAHGTSEVLLHSGHLVEYHMLAPYHSLGSARSIEIKYDSGRLPSNRSFFFRYPELNETSTNTLTRGGGPTVTRVEGQLEIVTGGRVITTKPYGATIDVASQTGDSTFVVSPFGAGRPYGDRIQISLASLPTGEYEARLTLGIYTYADGVRRAGSSQTSSWDFINVNSRFSALGAGWDISGLQRLVPVENGVLLVNGNGTELMFTRNGNGYDSPTGDFSSLVLLPDGTFRRTMTDQTVYQFNAMNLLASVRDRNGNTTSFDYDAIGNLLRITDPVGLVTKFHYADEKVASIEDPSGRLTQLSHDQFGNLSRITDPDLTRRTFTYTASNRMTGEVNKRDFSESAHYDPAGRVDQVMRRDESILQFRVAQSGSAVGQPVATTIDANGNVTRYELDQAGQAVSMRDGVGALGATQRNEDNRPVQTLNPRGFESRFEYDSRGNVVAIEDVVPGAFLVDRFSSGYVDGSLDSQAGGTGWHGPWFEDQSGIVRSEAVDLAYPGISSERGGMVFNGNNSASVSRPIDFPDSETLYVGFLIRPYSTLGHGFSIQGSDDAIVSIGSVNTSSGPNWSLLARDAKLSRLDAFRKQVVADSGRSVDVSHTHYLVARIDFNTQGPNATTGGLNERIRLYVNPLPGEEPTLADAEISVKDIGNPRGIEIGASSLTQFDEIRAGDSYASIFDNMPALFRAGQLIEDGDGALYPVLGDVNVDGFPDLIHTNRSSNTLSVRLGTGQGQFALHTDLMTPDGPTSLELADLNGDDALDIISLNLANNVSVWLGNGDGSFQSRADYAVTTSARGLKVGDVDNDGDLDLVVASSRGGIRGLLSVFLNNGDGTFPAPIEQSMPNFPWPQIALGDINEDGNLDLVTLDSAINQERIYTMFGDGMGRFPTFNVVNIAGARSSTQDLSGVAIDDANRDGHLDLAFTRLDTDSVSVWLGDGTGVYPSRQDFAAGASPVYVQFADINGDELPDLVYSDSIENKIGVRLGDGNGGFGNQMLVATPDSLAYFSISDIDADGDNDLVLGTAASQVAVLDNITNGQSSEVGVSDLGGFRREFTYDPIFNQLTSATDELGRLTLFEIDPANGNTLSMTNVIGLPDVTSGETDDVIISFAYTAQGLVDTAIDPLGRVTDFDYDTYGRFVLVTVAVGTTDEAAVSYEYDLVGNATAIIDENGNRSEFEYDVLNRVTKITEADPDGDGPLTSPVSTFQYDANGNVIRTTDPQGSAMRSTYDEMDRVLSVRDDQDNVTQFRYDPNGNLIKTIDPLGNVTRNSFDARNRVVESIDPDGGITRFTYDANNNLTSLIDPVGNETRYQYDFRDRVTKEIDPLGKSTQYEYDAVDNLIAQIDRNGRKTEYHYDDLDRIVDEIWLNADGSIANQIDYDYDKASNLTAIDDFFSELAYTYDNRDRVQSVDNAGTPGAPNVVLDYMYDGVSNVLSVTDTIEGTAGATTSYAYDALNRTTRITQTGIDVSEQRVDFAYNALGQYDRIARFSDLAGTQPVVVTTYQYDDLNRLIDLRHRNSAEDVAFYEYTYDDSSRITSINDIDGLTTYTYDDRDQLTGADRDADDIRGDESYTYDANGNRIESHLHGTGYVTGAANRLISDGTYNYTYDDEGNMTFRTEIATGDYREFNWDHRNRLTRVTDFTSGGVITQQVDFIYDAFDRRIAKSVDATLSVPDDESTTHFVYDREDVLLNFVDSDGRGIQLPTRGLRYLHGPGIDQVVSQENVAHSNWLLTDHLGSTRDLTDDLGQILNHLSFDSYGTLIEQNDSDSTARYLYSGREFDFELALYFFRARYFDSAIGSFLTEDPIGSASDVNHRRFARNQPSQRVDSGGYDSTSVVEEAIQEFLYRVERGLIHHEVNRLLDLRESTVNGYDFVAGFFDQDRYAGRIKQREIDALNRQNERSTGAFCGLAALGVLACTNPISCVAAIGTYLFAGGRGVATQLEINQSEKDPAIDFLSRSEFEYYKRLPRIRTQILQNKDRVLQMIDLAIDDARTE